jgi:hypothetical protein
VAVKGSNHGFHHCLHDKNVKIKVDYKSMQLGLHVLCVKSLKESNELDNSLAFVNMLKSSHADAAKYLKKVVSYTVILISDDKSFKLTDKLRC